MKTHDLLLETVDVEITSDMSKYASYAREYILDMYHDRAARDDEEVNEAEAEELINELVDNTKTNLEKFTQKIKSSLNLIEDKWSGSKILITVSYLEGWDFSLYAADDFSVKVYKVHERGAPDFTVFTMGQQIDDILDAGDTDFFVDADVEHDYFLLVNLLRNPEVFSDPDRALWLYTARPKKDRHIYDRDNKVPSNIFLTSDAEEAFGYAQEYPDRDVYKMKIKQRYLTQTLDAPGKKNFQTISKTGWVPVESSDRLTEAKLNEAKKTPVKKFMADIKEVNFHRIDVKFKPYTNHTVELVEFYAYEPGQGTGTLAMEVITQLADKHGVTINLIMDVSSDEEALERFYTNFDFVEHANSEMIRKPQNRRQLNEEKKQEWIFGAYYITTQVEAEKIREEEFGSEVRKGPLGTGIYFTGEEFTAFESLEKIVIQIRVEMNNPLVIKTKSKEELIEIVKQTDFKVETYDGVLWLDPLTSDLQRGIAFISSNVYYERNPYDLFEEQRLDEKIIQLTNRQHENFKVLVNPTVTAIRQSSDATAEGGILRALLDFPTGDFYVWDGYKAIHTEVIRMLGLHDLYAIHFTILPSLSFEYQEPGYEIGREIKKLNPDRLNSENMKTYLSRSSKFKLPISGYLNESDGRQSLDEKAIKLTNCKDEHFVVFENPTIPVIQRIMKTARTPGSARALLDFDTGTFYVWDGFMAIHYDVIGMLGLDSSSSVHFYVYPDLRFEYTQPLGHEVARELRKIGPGRREFENMKLYLSRLGGFKLIASKLLNESHDPYKEYEISYVELIERLTPTAKRFLNKQYEEDYAYIRNLAAKIKEEGWDNKPLILTPEPNGQFYIFDGNHRVNAIRKFGLDVPYIKYRLTAPAKPLKKRV